MAPVLVNNIEVAQLAGEAAIRSDAGYMGLIHSPRKSGIERTGENVVHIHTL